MGQDGDASVAHLAKPYFLWDEMVTRRVWTWKLVELTKANLKSHSLLSVITKTKMLIINNSVLVGIMKVMLKHTLALICKLSQETGFQEQ